MFDGEREPKRECEQEEICFRPVAKCLYTNEQTCNRQKRDGKIGHHHRPVGSDGRVDQYEEKRTECHRSAENAECGQGKEQQKQTVEEVHCPANTCLDEVGVIVLIHCRLDELALICLVVQEARRSKLKDALRHSGGRDKLDQRWMFGVQEVFAGAEIRDARGDVPRFVDCESIPPSGPG